ncbi:MAG: ATPase domain-containing protein, partial [Candidatus Micrarchaeia archaeon]
DPVTPYLVQFENPYDARLALVRLTNVVRKWNATVLLMNEVSEKAPPSPATTISEFFTDGVINLIHRRTEEGIQLRGIEIWKMYGVAHMEVARPFAFTKRGIVVYPTERLFAKSR